MQRAPSFVTMHLWGVRPRHLPWALQTLARRGGLSGTVDGLRFVRLLGTGHDTSQDTSRDTSKYPGRGTSQTSSRGHAFTPLDADPRHWALLASWDSPQAANAFEQGPYVRRWDAHSFERWRVAMTPMTSKGRWAGREPFLVSPEDTVAEELRQAPCAVLTRARLVPRKAVAFWRSIPPVAHAVTGAPGLRFARGIGEAPIGLQATFSIWDDVAAMRAFAYRTPDHRRVVERTREVGWYAEELFARFAVIEAAGTVGGRDPLLGCPTLQQVA